MKRKLLASAIMLLVPALILGAAVPVFRTGDRIAVKIEEGSLEEKALKAATSELTEDWFLKWTTGEKLLRSAGWKTLDGLLPMEDCLVLEEKDGSVAVYSMKTGALVSFTFDGGLINAVSVMDSN